MTPEESPGDATGLLVLAVLAGGPAHGYEIVRRVRDRSAASLSLREGSLYPLLHGLEADGLVVAEWDEGTGRRRRVYRLTEAGRMALQQQREAWARRTRAVQRVLSAEVPYEPA